MKKLLGTRFVAGELLSAMTAGVIALLAAVAALRVSPTDLGLRWEAGDADQVLHYTIFTSARDAFPFLANDRLGFPASQDLFFAPLFDLWSAIVVWGTSGIVPDGIWALNLYNIGGFAAAGFTAYLFFRALRLARATAIVFGAIFATVPYHFVQLTIGHPFLANYWAVPLAGILVLMTAGERTDPFSDWIARASTPRLRLARRVIPIVTLAVAVAFTQSYYMVFAALIMASVWMIRVITVLSARKGIRSLAWPTVTAATLLTLVGAELGVLAQNFGERYERYFGTRSFAESEAYGGKMIDLLLPSRASGITPFANRAETYRASTGILQSSESASSAVLASIAIVVCFTLILVRLSWRPRSAGAISGFLSEERIGVLLTAFLIGFLFFITSGLGTVLAFFVSPEIRAWSRMSIVVSMFALGVLALLVERCAARFTRRRPALFCILAVVVAVAVVDQLPRVDSVLPIKAVPDVALRAFVTELENRLPVGCGVAMLPVKGFPETGPVGAMGDYDEALPYIAASQGDADLRWSYGAVDGTRSADFWSQVTTPTQFGAAVAQVHSCAVVVDTAAYPRGSEPSAGAEGWAGWVAATGSDPAMPSVGSGDRYLVFDIGG